MNIIFTALPRHATVPRESGPVHLPAAKAITARDILILAQFTTVYCRARHPERSRERVAGHGLLAPYFERLEADLCPECARTLLHGAAKRALCPLDPKPRCKHCPTPCYAPGHREKVRRIMRFSGLRLITRGRLDLLFKYLF